MQLIRLHMSPMHQPLDTLENLVLKVSTPLGSDHVTLQIAPNIIGYAEQRDHPGTIVKQEVVTIPTDETRSLRFDINGVRKHVVQVQHKGFSIELMQIGTERHENQDFY